MRFDLSDLRLFVAVVEAGSITHGASAANLSLAAASERLREMEVSGGVVLLERGRRGVSPTAAGEALAHHARLVLAQVGAMRSELSEHARGIRGSVRLLANSAAITEFLPGRLGSWLAAHPGIDVDLGERASTDIVKALAGRIADIGILSDAAETGDLLTVPFAVDRLVAVMAKGHPMAGEKAVAFARLLDEDRIGYAGALQAHVDEHAKRTGRSLRSRATMRTFDGVCRMAAEGAGVGIVPETAARRCRRSMPIVAVRLADPWARRRLLLCCRNFDELEPFARRLFDHLSRPAGDRTYSGPAGLDA